ncbi:MAG: LysR family transcriptional regulator, partial [Pseudonocardia sp.]|nr:LysR family transcriptional regulator [Pseudonocardia sp.]
DELLTRVGNRYELTPLAQQLRLRTPLALAGVERVFASEPQFDPASSHRTFTVLASDYPMSVLGAHLGAVLDATAPGVRVRFERHSTAAIDDAEETLRAVDGLVLPHGFVQDLPHLDLWTDDWVLLVAATNSAVGEAVTMANLAELPWVLTWHAPSAFTPAARQLQMLGVEPRVQLVAESFLALPWLVAGSDRIALVQREVASRLTFDGQVRVLPCPYDAVPITEAVWWHPVHDRDPEHAWLRSALVEAGSRIMANRPVTAVAALP